MTDDTPEKEKPKKPRRRRRSGKKAKTASQSESAQLAKEQGVPEAECSLEKGSEPEGQSEVPGVSDKVAGDSPQIVSTPAKAEADKPDRFFVDLVRHGAVDGPAALYGRTDVPLTRQGLKQVERADLLGDYQAVISSPLRRCQDAGRSLAERYETELAIEPAFAEMDFGAWDGQPFEGLQDQWSLLESFWANPCHVRPPGGESLAEFSTRVEKGFLGRLEQLQGDELWVVHGGVIRLLLARLLGVDPARSEWHQRLAIGHGSVTRLCVMPSLVQVVAIGLPFRAKAKSRSKRKT